MVYPWGVEQSLLDSVSSAQPKYGIMKDNKLRTWIDCIQEQKLADEIFLVTWHSWQISAGKTQTSLSPIHSSSGLQNSLKKDLHT
jgi:transposase-like protein